MFAWLRSLFGKKEEFALDLYKPSLRQIYRYYDGQKVVTADPLVIYKRLMDRGPTLAVDMKVSATTMKGNVKAHDDSLRKIREIFDVKPLDQGGLTEIETLALLDHYLVFEDVQKKIAPRRPTSPGETSPSSSPSTDAAPPTPSSTDSGSTDAGPSTEPPTPPPSEPESPST